MEPKQSNLVTENWRWKKVYTAGIIPGPRHVCASVVWNNKLWVFAGYGWKGCYLNDLYEFDFATREWTQLHFPKDKAPPERHSMSYVLYKDTMVMFGGIGPSGTKSAELITYNLQDQVWAVVATQGAQPAGRWGHSAVVHNDRMYVYGGYGDTFLSDMYEYNFTTNMWAQVQTLGPKPKPRHFHAAVVYQDNMYMFGGFAGNKNTADMHKFHFATSSWSPITQVAREAFVNRRGHSAVVHTNCIYVFGGRGDMHNLNDLVEYNIDTGAVKTIEPEGDVAPPRYFHIAAVWGDIMWIWGGLSRANLNDMFSFTFKEKEGASTEAAVVNFRELLGSPIFSDIEFVVEGRPMPAHKNILFVRSEHFRAMLTHSMKESSQSQIELKGVAYDTFKLILEWIYTGNVTITANNAVELLIASDQFLLHDLSARCEEGLMRAVSSDTLLELLVLADAHHRKRLKAKCFQTAAKWTDIQAKRLLQELPEHIASDLSSFILTSTDKPSKV